MSVQGAMLHVITDILQSIGVLIGSVLIYVFGTAEGGKVEGYNSWHLADPICTLIFSVMVIISTRPLTLRMINIIMHKN